jgi:predicted enzyme related to lactoylglutathione lyase
VCWVDLACPDLPGARDFYRDLFGWSAGSPTDGHLDFELDGRVTAGATAAAGDRAAWVTYVSTDDVDATVAAVVEHGGRVVSPPTTLSTRGRTAACADPEGAVFGLWQRAGFSGTQALNEPGAPCWGELWTRDTGAAAPFYKAVFGWAQRAGEFAATVAYSEWYVAGRTVGGVVTMTYAVPATMPAHWGTIFQVRDCGAVAARCVELGGMAVVPPGFYGVGTAAYLLDAQGAMFGIFEPIPELLDTAVR